MQGYNYSEEGTLKLSADNDKVSSSIFEIELKPQYIAQVDVLICII